MVRMSFVANSMAINTMIGKKSIPLKDEGMKRLTVS